MNERFPTVAIWITAATWAGFGLWLGWNPGELLPAFGVDLSTPATRTEIRAFYGGVELMIAATMGLLWWRGDVFASLLVGGLPLLGAACGRLIGLMLDGYTPMHLGFAALELIGSAVCLAGCRTVAMVPPITSNELDG